MEIGFRLVRDADDLIETSQRPHPETATEGVDPGQLRETQRDGVMENSDAKNVRRAGAAKKAPPVVPKEIGRQEQISRPEIPRPSQPPRPIPPNPGPILEQPRRKRVEKRTLLKLVGRLLQISEIRRI